MRKRHMGAEYTPGMQDVLERQLVQYKNQLRDLYFQKNADLANRETDRFQYLAAWRSQLMSILNSISSDVFAIGNPMASALWNNFQIKLKASIPMENMSGKIPKYNDGKPEFQVEPLKAEQSLTDPDAFLGVLSPVERWLTPEGGLKPIERFPGVMSGLLPLHYRDQFASVILANQSMKKWPWSSHDLALSYGFSNMSEADKASAAQVVQPFLSKVYAGQGDLYSVLASGQEILLALVTSTQKLLRTQENISSLELQIKDFLDQFRAHGNISTQAGDVYNELTELSKNSEMKMLESQVSAPPVNSTVVSPEETFPPGTLLPMQTEHVDPAAAQSGSGGPQGRLRADEVGPSPQSAASGGGKKVPWGVVAAVAGAILITMG